MSQPPQQPLPPPYQGSGSGGSSSSPDHDSSISSTSSALPTPTDEKKPSSYGTVISPSPDTKNLNFSSSSSSDLSEASEYADLTRNPFLDPVVAAHWRKVYEEADYECRAVFDPSVTWTEEEEKAIIRKIDFRACAWAIVMFFALQVDRGNLSQALADGMLDDLGLDTNDYNYGNVIFLVSFLCAELPSQLLSKKLGPDRWIPIQIVLWSVVAISQCSLNGRGSFFATRCLLGLIEGGFIPDIVLWLSYFYTSRELPIRLSYFWTTLSTTSIITSLMAFGLLHMRGINGWAGWQWMFLVEGLITLCIGLASFFMMPASAVQTKTWFRPNGWFTDREVSIVVNRVLRDDPSKGDMHNREAITPKRLWETLKDYDLWPLYAIGLVAYIPQTPVNYYLTLTLRRLGFSAFNTNLLVIPSSVVHIITLLLLTRLSDILKERTFVAMLQCLWTLPCILALRFWPGLIENAWGTYALMSVLLSYPYCHAILVAWTSKNANNVGARSVSAALYNMSVQLGNVVANFIYLDYDKPYYHDGNTKLVVINLLAIGVFLFTKAYYVWRNKQKDKVWNGLTEEQKAEYIKTTKVQGSRRLDFRFAH
ncbi:major facilitator superfamily domain-containing protein [Neurospora hispaniola]|uniref:Major facilitator superfamily domain-containing protein n=1 Tax=Neurospora hispaniola TaxID=588809 RepID=A0AAJ0HZ40_9PEZI|nr:major facilitator superfamily domain-containing protein [Neurospora hispaniola]